MPPNRNEVSSQDNHDDRMPTMTMISSSSSSPPYIKDYHSTFSVESLIRSMAPIDYIIDRFVDDSQRRRQRHPHRMNDNTTTAPPPKNNNDSTPSYDTTTTHWSTPESQNQFATLISSISNHRNSHRPSDRYLKKLVLRYVNRIERCADDDGRNLVEGEDLVELLSRQMTATRRARPSFLADDPDPNDWCHLAFDLPSREISLRVYPHHPSVGMNNVWEAGCCLAEFLLDFPRYVEGKNVLELGAGVGVTGIVAKLCCGAERVFLTDYEGGVIENLVWNVGLMGGDSDGGGDDDGMVTAGYMEWNDYASSSSTTRKAMFAPSPFDPEDVHVILAADVIYDTGDLSPLVGTVKRLLCDGGGNGKECLAIIASTLRHERTFKVFRKELKVKGVRCEDVPGSVVDGLGKVFPCYFRQPREHVKISIMRVMAE